MPDTERIQKSQVSEKSSAKQIRDTRPLTSRPVQCTPWANTHKTSRRKPDGDLASPTSGITSTPTRLCLSPPPASFRAARLGPPRSEQRQGLAGGAPGSASARAGPETASMRTLLTPAGALLSAAPGEAQGGQRVGKTLQSFGSGGKKHPSSESPHLESEAPLMRPRRNENKTETKFLGGVTGLSSTSVAWKLPHCQSPRTYSWEALRTLHQRSQPLNRKEKRKEEKTPLSLSLSLIYSGS